jgi:glutamine synthetase
MKEHGAIIFNGDGYSEAWHKEAEERGLPNLRTSATALPALGSPEAVALFDKYDVMSPRETASRLDVKLEQYVMAVNVEASLTAEIAQTMIYPAAARYLGELAGTAANLKAAGCPPIRPRWKKSAVWSTNWKAAWRNWNP